LKKILIIQTAFIGDVILATPLIEKLYDFFPGAKIDFLLRKGNESLFTDHPKLNEVIVWDKKNNKYWGLFQTIGKIRKKEYDLVVNLQRFAASGLMTALSKGTEKVGFDKNPFSFTYTDKIKHQIGTGLHETVRNLRLIRNITGQRYYRPQLYPTAANFEKVKQYQKGKYVCIAPTSVWFTKQYPAEKWLELIHQIDESIIVYLLGAPSDKEAAEAIQSAAKRGNISVLCGELNFLDSAALMKGAAMNYVNDSAPMHMASAVNATTTAIYCSTIPSFGFGPVATDSVIVETKKELECRPCGLHGRKKCPLGHFDCAHSIETSEIRVPSV